MLAIAVARGALELEMIDAPVGGDDEVGPEARPQNGLTRMCVRRVAPLPLVVSPTIQRAVSPAATAVTASPG